MRAPARRALTATALAVLGVLAGTLPAAATANRTIHVFDGVDGGMPASRLMQASDGYLYGTSPISGEGGNDLDGLIYRISLSGAYQVVHRFDRCDPAGYDPIGGLIQASDGFLYGATSRGGVGNECEATLDTRSGAVYRLDPRTFSVTPIHTFDREANGLRPSTALIQGRDGALYGTTNVGGKSSLSYPLGRGTIFRLTTAGDFRILRRFDGCDGFVPNAPLALGSDGLLYGTTSARRCPEGNGTGTVFSISTRGAFRLLHVFSSSDGAEPRGRLVEAADGRWYGVTTKGGPYQDGVVYRITKGGVLTVLHEFGFDGGFATTGMEPMDGLTIARDGSFYGTASLGGIPVGFERNGVLFKLSRSGAKLGVIDTFMEGEGGIQPRTGVVLASNGRLYGTTIGGPSRLGTIFRYTPTAKARLESVSVYPEEIWSGEGYPHTTTGRVILDGLAPAGGATVALATDRPDLVTLPASVSVAAGWAVAEFDVEVGPARRETVVTISATFDGVTKRTTFAVYAAG